ncbi:MAG TPA: sulfotransferase [Stellaceae bacterium]|jgi:hypothetical protein
MLPLYPDRVLADSREVWRSYDRVVGSPAPELRHLLPDFLIIGAPKAGTSWLFSVLATHPEIFIPVEKELQYFNKNWRWMPVDDYLRHFEPGASRRKGEATTSYCRLPSVAIETIKRLKPDIKLLYLVRDPVEQAWSQMKHLFRYRNANFWRYQCLFENLTQSNYIENFLDDLALSCVDHYDTLRRWMRIFPRENFWVASLEEIGADPEAVYRSAATFLGLSPPPSIDQTLLQSRVNEGLPYRLDAETATILRTLHQPRALRFLDYARREFGKDFASFWRHTLSGEILPDPLPIAENFYGWRIVVFAGKLWAYPKDAGAKIAVTRSEIKSTDPGTPLHAADFNYELQRKIGVIDTPVAPAGKTRIDQDLEDARLERAASGLPMLTITFVVDEIEELGDYFAARMIACSEASAVERSTSHQESVSRISGAEIASAVPVHVGMRKDMWPPQPWMAPMLERNGLPPVIFVAGDRASLRRELAPFVRSSGEPIIEESYRGYNIIRLRHDLIAVKQSLGAIDLSRPLEQLTRQFDADDFMTDTDLGALRVRIAEAAGRQNTRAIFGELHTQIERMKEEQNASIEQLREQLATVQDTLTGALENAPGRRLIRAMRRLFSWSESTKLSRDVRASPDKSVAGGR